MTTQHPPEGPERALEARDGKALSGGVAETVADIVSGRRSAGRATIRVLGIKPRLRGYPDLVASFFIVPAAALLMGMAQPGAATVAAVVYTLSLATVFGVSASYHVPMWSPAARGWWRRADHSAIYVLIAGTYTPACLMAMPESGTTLLPVVWAFAALGLIKTFVWPYAPRWLNTTIYLAFGWMIAPFAGELWANAGSTFFALVAAGGVLYSVGAVVYAKRLLDLKPAVFGYHEVFHLFVIAAAVCHYLAVWGLLVA